MPDPLAGPADGDDASATAPVLTKADIEKVRAELQAEFDERAKGFQRLLAERDTKLAAFENELGELKTSGLSEDEREQLIQTKLQQENQALRGKLELNELARNGYGDIMPVYERLISATSAEEQLKIMQELRAPAPAPDPVPEVPAGGEIPDTDPNRPLRSFQEGITLPDGSLMNDALADKILGSVNIQADVTQRGR